jgi:hypothetical protein
MSTLGPALVLTLMLGAPADIASDELAVLPFRELVIRSAHVVLAVPLDPVNPDKFRVVEVLRGRELKRGSLVAPDLTRYEARTFDPPVPPITEPQPRRIALALLFLGPQSAKGKGVPLVPGGLRFCTEDARVLAPVIHREALRPARYTLEVQDTSWPQLLFQTGRDAAEVERLFAGKQLSRPEQRRNALLDWVRRHRRDFGSKENGWGELEEKVFDWIQEDCGPEEAWQALHLQAEVHGGVLPTLRRPVFGSPAGREFLTARILDDKALLGDRTRALTLLRDPLTLQKPQPLTELEQSRLLDQLIPLLDREKSRILDVHFRAALACTVAHLSRPGSGLPVLTRAVEPLMAVYRSETPGLSRDELADAICGLATAEQWKNLTGNPPGVLVTLRDLEKNPDKVHFWLCLRPGSPTVFDQPTLQLTRLGSFGLPAETRKEPLAAVNLPRPWKEGWTGAEYLLVEIPIRGLTPGTWRLSVTGTAGKERSAWTSEPKRFVIEAPAKRDR